MGSDCLKTEGPQKTREYPQNSRSNFTEQKAAFGRLPLLTNAAAASDLPLPNVARPTQRNCPAIRRAAIGVAACFGWGRAVGAPSWSVLVSAVWFCSTVIFFVCVHSLGTGLPSYVSVNVKLS